MSTLQCTMSVIGVCPYASCNPTPQRKLMCSKGTVSSPPKPLNQLSSIGPSLTNAHCFGVMFLLPVLQSFYGHVPQPNGTSSLQPFLISPRRKQTASPPSQCPGHFTPKPFVDLNTFQHAVVTCPFLQTQAQHSPLCLLATCISHIVGTQCLE